MAESLPSGGAVRWFTDVRTPARRMKVTWHEDADLVVFSLWQGPACTGTFRLPAADAAPLIHLLVDGAAAPRPQAAPAARPSLGQRLAGAWRRRRKPPAPVVSLRDGSRLRSIRDQGPGE